MRNLKRVLSLALALVMVLGMMVITTSAADYTDADEITYKEAVEVMSAIGILEGSPNADGTFTFNPTGTLQRDQAAKILAFVCLGNDAKDYLTGSTVSFEDVAADHWAAMYIAFCKNAKIVNGVNDEQTLFNPTGTLTTVQFAKMLLVALGIEGEYTGANWENNVKNAIKNNPALNVLTIDTSDITREEACELALAAMKYSANTGKYQIVDADENPVETYDDLITAQVYCNLLNDGGDDYKVQPAPKTDALLTKYYNVNWTVAGDGAKDSYGRGATVYTYDVEGTENDWALTYVTEKAVKTYTAATKAEDIAKDLKGYKIFTYTVEGDHEAKWKGNQSTCVKVDGAADAAIGTVAGLTENCTLSEALAALTGDNKVVEFYANNTTKALTKIVIVETNYAVVTNAVEADAETETDASFKVDGKTVTKVEGFKNGDVVTYVEDSTGVTEVTKLEGFAGTMTKYTKAGIYTIGDAEYKVSAAAIDGADTLAAAIVDKQGDEMFYFLDKNGDIVDMTVVPGEEEEEEVVIKDYALIADAKIVRTTEEDVWTDAETHAYAIKVKAILSNGTVDTYELPVVQNDEEAWVYMIGKTEYPVAGLVGSDNTATAISALVNNVYTYTVDGDEITLASAVDVFYGDEGEDEDGVYYRASKGSQKAGTTIATKATGATVLVNENTVFIIDDGKTAEGYEVKVGIAAMKETTISDGSRVVVDVTYNEDGNLNIATVVFAVADTFDAGEAQTASDYIYIDGDYVVTKATVNGEKVNVYTYTGVKEDGTTIEVTGEEGLDAGIYAYDSDLVIGDAASTSKVTVGVISGTTVKIGEEYVTVDADTVIVDVAEGAALATGAECYMTDGLIYIVKAAPAK